MEPADPVRVPADVLIVKDNPIIALDFEDTILNLGVGSVRCAGSVATALDPIAARVAGLCAARCGARARKEFCGGRETRRA